MLKKLDKLILKAFIGPFILTFLVVDFILLVQFMLGYTEELVGKDVGFVVFGKMLFYFSLTLTPMALPLAILLASLITFGNLGEHFELTAIKGAGISLVRVLMPIGALAILLSVIAFWFNNKVVPYSNLKAYSTLYNVRFTKAALDLKEGAFYNGIPNYSIKAGKKYPDGKTLKEVIIYNHSSKSGNREVILADSGLMYTINDGAYLVLELFKGNSYTDYFEGNASPEQLVRNNYDKAKMVFNLSSFKTKDVSDSSFTYHRYMKNVSELEQMIDSLKKQNTQYVVSIPKEASLYYIHFYKELMDTAKVKKILPAVSDSLVNALYHDKLFKDTETKAIIQRALGQARSFKNFVDTKQQIISNNEKNTNEHIIEMLKKYTFACACFIMFFIGAPLGSIIKKGGLGVPTLVAVFFFIIYYILSMTGEKWAKESIVSPEIGMWSADIILFMVGLLFLNQARNDSRMFDKDAYLHLLKRLKRRFEKKDNVLENKVPA